MKTVLSVLIMGLLCPFLKAQDKKELNTEITHVTVFSTGAQVHRSGTIMLPGGQSTIRIKGLTPDLDPKSIQVKCNDAITILSVFHEWNSKPAANSNHAIDSLFKLDRIAEVRIRELTMRNQVLDRKLGFLQDNQQVGSKTTGITVEQLQNAMELFETTWMSAHREKLLIAQQLDTLQALQKEMLNQISVIRGTPMLSKSEIELIVFADLSRKAQIEISYIVHNAGWIPRYDIRAKDISQPIEVVYKADVHQQTGEVWNNVKLTFSNASPYAKQIAPELETWKLTTLANTTFRRIGPAELVQGARMITGNVRDNSGEALIFANVMVAGHNLGTQTDLNGNFSLLLPQDANSIDVSYTGYAGKTIPVNDSHLNITMSESLELNEVTVIGMRAGREKMSLGYSVARITGFSESQKYQEQAVVVIDNQVSVEFELEKPTTVLSDGKNSSLDLQAYEIPADYRYETTPKLDKGAYLIATLTNWEKYHLIEGQANLYFNNTFIGKTILDPLNLSDTLEISLGRDPEVLVERIKEDEFTKKTFLGANTIVEKSIKLSFRNKKQYPVHIQVSDQIPMSINDAITVSATQISGGTRDENSGIIKWDLNIEPTSNKDLLMSYAVKYPSRERVILE